MMGMLTGLQGGGAGLVWEAAHCRRQRWARQAGSRLCKASCTHASDRFVDKISGTMYFTMKRQRTTKYAERQACLSSAGTIPSPNIEPR
jgi:hypothetical protein